VSPSGPADRPAELSPAACGDLLKQHFPALFTGAPKPLKLRIQADIQQRAPGIFSKNALGAFFRRYTGSTGYLIALGKASQRFDLDGQGAGELSEEHRQLARDELARRRQLTRERDLVAQSQQQARQQALQAEQAEQLQARQARAALLRDFERTTLTPANFCALKGLTPEALAPQLAQARQEAAEAPPLRPAEERRGPPGLRRDDRHDGRHDARRDTAQAPRGDGRSPRPEARDARAPGPRPAGPARPGGAGSAGGAGGAGRSGGAGGRSGR
jgi:sRNA-binding protein